MSPRLLKWLLVMLLAALVVIGLGLAERDAGQDDDTQSDTFSPAHSELMAATPWPPDDHEDSRSVIARPPTA